MKGEEFVQIADREQRVVNRVFGRHLWAKVYFEE